MGVQTFEKQLDGVVIWEGNRTEVDAFEFADGVSVNVINVSTTDLADNPVFDTVGTDGIDLIFGDAGDNLIDGKGGDDIIFGGSGDDVIIGGEGDDVILGGDGADILRGDMVESGDAAITAWQAAATQFNADNPGENIVFDENKLSLQLSDSVDADDLILGGDQLDDIESGDGGTLSHLARPTLMVISRLTRMSLTSSTHKSVIHQTSSMMMSGCKAPCTKSYKWWMKMVTLNSERQ